MVVYDAHYVGVRQAFRGLQLRDALPVEFLQIGQLLPGFLGFLGSLGCALGYAPGIAEIETGSANYAERQQDCYHSDCVVFHFLMPP